MHLTIPVLTISMLLMTTFVILSVVFMMKSKRRYSRLLKRYSDAKKSNGELKRKYLIASYTVQEEERRRISRDLHDEVGSNLTALKFNLVALSKERFLHPENRTGETLLFGDIFKAIDEIIARNKDIVYDISPEQLEQFGLGIAIESLFRRIRTTYTIIARLTMDGEPRRLTPTQELMMYRIVQEFLCNAMKYSNRWRFLVNIGWEHDCVLLQIMDEARYTPNQHTRGMGLSNIRNRVLIIGGTLESKLTSVGNYVNIRIPYEHQEN